MTKRRIQRIDLQKQEIEEKLERRLLIRFHIFYLITIQENIVKDNKVIPDPIDDRKFQQ